MPNVYGFLRDSDTAPVTSEKERRRTASSASTPAAASDVHGELHWACVQPYVQTVHVDACSQGGRQKYRSELERGIRRTIVKLEAVSSECLAVGDDGSSRGFENLNR